MAAQAQPQVIPLWPEGAPGSEGWAQEEVEYRDEQGHVRVRNVVEPTLTAYLPPSDSATGTAVVIAPGGAFRFLSWQTEGTDVARWLTAHGVAAFVLKYRLVDTGPTEEDLQKNLIAFFTDPDRDHHEAEKALRAMAAADGKQAVRVVREQAASWGLAPDRVGLLGFSAGGYVAVEAAMTPDAESRPDFAAPIYACCFEEVTVPEDAPPLFILAAHDDPLVAGSPRLYAAWREAGASAELHIYARGGHGFGMQQQGLPVDAWIERFGDWLRGAGYLDPSP